MLKKIVLDLETQKSFQEVGGRGKNHLLKVSVCVIYDYTTDRYTAYEERELGKLSPILQTADQIIGYNIKDFDFEVLQPYLNFNLSNIPYLDLLEEIEKVLQKLKADAEAKIGETITDAIITCPAYFDDSQRKATKTGKVLRQPKPTWRRPEQTFLFSLSHLRK